MHATEVYWKGQARTIREAAEAWQEEHEEAQSILKFEASLDHPLATFEAFRKLYRAAWEDLFAGRLSLPLQAGLSLREMVRLLAQAFESLRDVLRGHERQGYVLARAGDVERAARELRRWEADLDARWPRFDVEALKAQSQEPPDFVSLEEIYGELPELRGTDQT